MKLKRFLCFVMVFIVVIGMLPITSYAAENWLWPVNGYYNISSGYDEPRSSKLHKGIDIDESYVGNITGKPVMASKGGIATVYWGYNGGAGNYVVIEHGDGYVSRYLHLDSIAISNGSVIRGQTIGYVGNTGDSSGPHLHFDIKYNGSYINNMPVNADNRHTYKWNRAEVTQNIRYDYDVSSSSNQTPGKPELMDFSPYYRTNKPVLFTWEATQNTTHYNIFIQKLVDGTYSEYETIFYAESGLTRSLLEGKYRVQLQSTNSNYNWTYTDGDWEYFTVLDQIEKPKLNNISPYYRNDKQVCFTWEPTADTTHYNIFIQKLTDDKYSEYETIFYAESGLTREFSEGSYRIQLQATNSYCYKDSGSTWLYQDGDWEYFQAIKEINKPILKELQPSYVKDEKIVFKWSLTEDATHYNIFIQKLTDDKYSEYETIFYAESGLTREFSEGSYRMQLQATNSYCYTDSGSTWLYRDGDWEYFSVRTSKPYIIANVTNFGSDYDVDISLYYLADDCDIIVVGYKGDKFATMDFATRNEQMADCTLTGDIDEIKVMVWDNMSNLKPLCEAVVIAENEWMIK